MRRYQVNVSMNGVTSAVDSVLARDGYTAEAYIQDCKDNADDEWNEMLEEAEDVFLIDEGWSRS